jgi:ubiquinone/menaquinone biosynthesis C-methylase UbiE
VLDLGCGTGAALRLLADRLPGATTLLGVDPAPAMLRVARERTTDPRVRVEQGVAERLPVPDGGLDLIVAVTSFDHWADQRAGLRECARALAGGGGHPAPHRGRVLIVSCGPLSGNPCGTLRPETGVDGRGGR